MHKWHKFTDMLWDWSLPSRAPSVTWQAMTILHFFQFGSAWEGKASCSDMYRSFSLRQVHRFGRVRPCCDKRPGLVQFERAHEVSGLTGSDVHVIVLLLVRLALQRRLLAGRLLHLQRRLAQSVLLHRGCRLRRQDDVLHKRRQQGALLNVRVWTDTCTVWLMHTHRDAAQSEWPLVINRF